MERWLPLGQGVRILVDDVHRFGTDSVLLADFAAPGRAETACDLGTGCGIVPLLWCRGEAPAAVTALDIQPEAVALLERSVAENGLTERVTPLLCDLRREPGELRGRFDLVTMNPPYQPIGAGAISPCEGRRLARHEIACTLEEGAACAARLLRAGGRFCLCHRPGRLVDVLGALRQAGLEPKRLRLIYPKPAAEPNLILLEGRKGSRPGLTVEPPFFLRDAVGEETAAMKAVYSAESNEKEVAP